MSLATAALLTAGALLSLGVALPMTGIDGGDGVRMHDAVALAAADAHAKLVPIVGAKPVQNPHQDEGTDNEDDVATADSGLRIAARKGLSVIVGPLRSNVALAGEPVLEQHRMAEISGTVRAPSTRGTRVFKLAPSDRQLAIAAAAWMRPRFGTRTCVLDDATPKARRQALAFVDADPAARHLSLAAATTAQDVAACLNGAGAVYATALEAEPVFCDAATARKAGPRRLVEAMSLRRFDPSAFAAAGKLWRAQAAPLPRSPAVEAIAQRYHARAFVPMDDDALRFYAATQIAERARLSAHRGNDPARILRTRTFATVIGPVRFDARGEIASPRIVVKSLN